MRPLSRLPISSDCFGNSKPAGSTPTTVYGAPPSVILRPTIDGSPPNRRRQIESASITTWCWP